MPDINHWLARAAAWRFSARLFEEPHTTSSGELQALVPLLPACQQAAASALALEENARWDSYFAVLGPGGCAATESAYDRAAMANRGPLIAEVSAFYEAFAYPVRLTSDLGPDHVVSELDFLGFLALKVASALYDDRNPEREIAEAAYLDFRDRHPRFWLEAFRDRLQETGAVPFSRAAAWVCETLAADTRDAAHA